MGRPPFLDRQKGHQAGVVLLFIVTLLYLVGSFAPQWIRYSQTRTDFRVGNIHYYYRRVEVHSSVLAGCLTKKENGTIETQPFSTFFQRSEDSCGLGYFDDSTSGGWVSACKFFGAIGIIALLLACIYKIRVEFCKPVEGSIGRYLELAVVIAVISAGAVGLLSAIIFLGKLGSTVRNDDYHSFSWSVFFFMFVCVLTIADGIIIAIFNRNREYINM